jgi:N-formylglutamate deformylase
MSWCLVGSEMCIRDRGLVIRHVTDEMRNSILENYYKVHHQKLSDAVKVQLKAHHKAVIIDCHSFPEIPLERSLVKDVPRPDFNIGTDEFHTPQELMDLAVHFFERKGYSLGIDSPYSGTIVPSEHYKRNNAVQSIMLEVNRRLYLVDKTNEKSSDYSKVKAVTNEFIRLVKNYVVNGI